MPPPPDARHEIGSDTYMKQPSTTSRSGTRLGGTEVSW